MLTITKQPGAIALSRNPMIVEFLATDGSGDPYAPQGVRSELRDQSSVGIDDGETLVLTWTEPDGASASITFTARDNPESDPNAPDYDTDIPTKNTPGIGLSVGDYWNATAEKIQAHPDVQPFFHVYRVINTVGTSYSLWIEAREISDDWTVSWDDSGILGAPTTVYDYPESAGTTAPDNYRVLVDVLFEEEYLSAWFVRVATIELFLNTESRAHLDLSAILDKALKKALPELGIPEFSSNTPYRNDVYRRYYLRYREKFDGDTEVWTKTTNRVVLCGGIAQNLFANYNFFSNLKATNSLLTYYPSGKSVSPDQPEWLSWYNYDNAAHEVLLQVRTWTADSNTPAVLYRLHNNGVIVQPMEVISLPVGPTQLTLADDVVKYEVRVIDRDDYDSSTITFLSQARNFYVDRLHYKEKRYIMYLNGFCLPETVRCIGDFSESVDVSRQIMIRPLPPDYSEAAAQIWQYAQDFATRFTYRTGYLSRAEADALQELLIYNEAYEVFAEGYIRLNLTTNRANIYETGNYLMSHAFQAEPRLKRKNYSNILIPMSVEQDGWIDAAQDYWLTVFSEPWQTP